MAQHDTGAGTGKHFYVRVKHLKSSDQEYPCLNLKFKGEDGHYHEKNTGALSGYLTSIEKIDKTEKINNISKRLRGVKFTIQDFDAQENYHFELLYSNPVRELLNRMCSLENFLTPLKISFYRNKESGFPGASLKKIENGTEIKVDRKYKYDQIIKPYIKTVMLSGSPHKDYDGVDNQFDNMIEKKFAVMDRMNGDTPRYSTNYTPPETMKPNTDMPFSSGGDDGLPDDLPFRFNDKPLKF